MNFIKAYLFSGLLVVGTLIPASYKDIHIPTRVDHERIEQQVHIIAHELHQLKMLTYAMRGTVWAALITGAAYTFLYRNSATTPEQLEGLDRTVLDQKFLDHIALCKNFNPSLLSMAWLKNNAKSIIEWTICSIAIKKLMEKTEQLAYYLATDHDIMWFLAHKTTIETVIADINYATQLLERGRIEGDKETQEYACSSLAVAAQSFIAQIELVIAYMHYALNGLPEEGINKYQLDMLPVYLTNSAQQLAQAIEAALRYDAQLDVQLVSSVARFEADFNKAKIRFARDAQRAQEYAQ